MELYGYPDVISLCLPIIDKFIDSGYVSHRFSDFIVRKYLEIYRKISQELGFSLET